MNVQFFRSALNFVGGAVCVVALVAGGAVSAQAAAMPTLSNLAQEEMSLLSSDQPKTVTIDPATGSVLSVMPGQPFQTQAVKSNCTGDYACWNGRPPSLSYGFNGSGSSGAWANRASFETRNYTATLCWSYGSTYCMNEEERAGKNSTIEFGFAVTGTRVSLSR